MARENNSTKAWVIVAAVLLLSCPVLMLAFSHFSSQLFPAYREFSKAFMFGISSVTRFVPFAIWDVLACVLVLAMVAILIHHLLHKQTIFPVLAGAVFLVCFTAWFLVAGWALNHYAPPLAKELGLEVGQYTTEELAQVTGYYLGRAAELAPQVPRSEEGSLTRQDFFELAKLAGTSYKALEKDYPVFAGSGAPVKALLLAGEPLLYSGHTGIFWAPTAEASVPLNCAIADMPFTMCHEAAHRLALAGEDEANFAAILACISNEDLRFQYAGYYKAFSYCFNALYAADPQKANAMLEAFTEAATEEQLLGAQLVFLDRADTREHYAAYEGPAQEVGTTANDTYLKSFGETEGVKSYGLVVDYLIASREAESSAVAE